MVATSDTRGASDSLHIHIYMNEGQGERARKRESERARQRTKEWAREHTLLRFVYFLCIPLVHNSIFNQTIIIWTKCFLWIC